MTRTYFFQAPHCIVTVTGPSEQFARHVIGKNRWDEKEPGWPLLGYAAYAPAAPTREGGT